MSAAVLQHPAVAIATDVARGLDTAVAPKTVLVRDGVAAVLLESPDHRFVIFVPYVNGSWVPPGMSGGTRRPASAPQERRTGEVPLAEMSGRGFATPGDDGALPDFGWFAVTGQAATDAVEVMFTSSVESVSEPVGDNGSVFALIRTRITERPDGLLTFEKPAILVRTQDGRAVPMNS